MVFIITNRTKCFQEFCVFVKLHLQLLNYTNLFLFCYSEITEIDLPSNIKHKNLSNIVLVPIWCRNNPDPSRRGLIQTSDGLLSEDVSNRSFKTCKLGGEASTDWVSFVQHIPPTIDETEIWRIRKHLKLVVMNLKPFLLCACVRYPAERGHSHEGIHFILKVYMVCRNA